MRICFSRVLLLHFARAYFGRLAQLVEQLTLNQRVAGSSPASLIQNTLTTSINAVCQPNQPWARGRSLKRLTTALLGFTYCFAHSTSFVFERINNDSHCKSG
jgi:hypothetical protein